MDFKDKVIVVTGGASGIGLQISKDLCNAKAIVHILGRTKTKLEKAKKDILNENKSSKIFIHQCDVSKSKDVKKVFDKIKKSSGLVYGLVNNAGINPSRNTIENTELKDWEDTLATNLTGPFNCSKEAVNHMKDLKKGSIVGISSVGGVEAFPYRTAYNVSKYGLIGLAQSIARDYSKLNIRSNIIAPGYVHTPLVDKFIKNMNKVSHDKLIRSHAMGRIGKTEEISKAVLFLLSEDASWITGTVLPVDGGYLLGRGA